MAYPLQDRAKVAQVRRDRYTAGAILHPSVYKVAQYKVIETMQAYFAYLATQHGECCRLRLAEIFVNGFGVLVEHVCDAQISRDWSEARCCDVAGLFLNGACPVLGLALGFQGCSVNPGAPYLRHLPLGNCENVAIVCNPCVCIYARSITFFAPLCALYVHLSLHMTESWAVSD